MSATTDNHRQTTGKAASRVLAAIWLIAVLLAARFLYTSVSGYHDFSEGTYGYLWPMRYWAAGHIVGGTLALTIGLAQMLPAIRRRYLAVHRWLGRVYLLAVIGSTSSAFVLIPTISLSEHWAWAVTLAALCSVWLLSTLMGYRAIRLRRIQQHKEWMIRSYVVTFAFVFFRILNVELFSDVGEFIERGPTFG
jgi:uncharacterized membrane protein